MTTDYLRRLEAALGDEEAFPAVYSELEADADVDAAEAKRLCLEFTAGRARSKSDALGKIWDRHRYLIGAKFRAEAVGNRLAG